MPSLISCLHEGLKNALEATIQETQNTTKAPNTDFLKNNGILEDNSGNDNNTSNDDVKVPKAPKVPEDLGCLNEDGEAQ